MQNVRCTQGSTIVLIASLALAAASAWGCSSSKTDPVTTPSATTPAEPVTVHVSAAQGGTVADKSGKVSLAIPAAALGTDTDITLAVTGATAGSAGDVYDFGPDGTMFAMPATLTVKVDPSIVTDGKTLAIGLFDGTTFKPVEGSTYADGTVTGPIAHFTKYSIVLVDGNAVLVPPATCAAAIAGFMPCGGDPTGTWTFADFCVDAKTLGLDPFKGACTQFVASVEATSTREITFGGGMQSTTAGTETTSFKFDFPISCAQATSPTATCATLSDTKTTCTDVGGGNCECTQTEAKPKDASTSTYTISGSVLTDGDGDQTAFCVNGDLLSAREIKDSGTPITYVLKKK